MSNKNMILEDLSRMHLLMKYDSKQTLSENAQHIPSLTITESSLLNEQKGGGLLNFIKNSFLAGADDAVKASANLAKATPNTKALFKELTTKLNFAKTDDLLNVIYKGKMPKSQIVKLKETIMLSKNIPETQIAMIFNDTVKNLGRNPKIKGMLSNSKTTLDDLINVIKNDIGYTDDALARKLAESLFKAVPKKPSSWWKNQLTTYGPKIWKFLKDNKGTIGLIGGAALLYYYFSDESNPLPNCIKNMATEDAIKEIETVNNYEFVRIAKTGNQNIDSVGGANFYLTSGNKVELRNGEVGTWSIVGNVVRIQTQTNTYDIKCADTGGGGTPPPPPPPPPTPKKYNSCTTFPMVMFCMAKEIREIQECLGITADGKFGPQTRDALKSNGYGNGTELTRQDYTAIINNCNKTAPKTEPNTAPLDTEKQGFTPDIIPSLDWLDKKY